MSNAEFRTAQDIKGDFNIVRRTLNLKDDDPVPVGVGFIGWILDTTEASDDPRLHAILEGKPAAIWFAFGVDLAKYVEQLFWTFEPVSLREWLKSQELPKPAAGKLLVFLM
ncbi:hypothetical protein PM082_010170 [Marasmius tenuissimus]|nr:hypothetical protein PM082_010170 [Marasmius tenuissimus]